MSTNNGTSLNHSPLLHQHKVRSNEPLVKPEVRQSESVRTRQFEAITSTISIWVQAGFSGC